MTMRGIKRSRLDAADIAVLVIYFLCIIIVGIWSSRRNRGSAGGYFLAGRNMNWIPIGASLYASNIGSLHFVGLAGSAAASGIAVGNYELNAIFVVLLLGYVFLPVYIASGVFTMPEYLHRRFGRERLQVCLAVLAILVYVFTKISADLYSGVIFLEQSLGWDMYGALLLLLSIAALFTITGGLTAVIWTDFAQTIIMLIGAFVLMVIGFNEVGGFHAMVEKYPQAIANTSFNQDNFTSNFSTSFSNSTPSTCGAPREDFMHLLRDPRTGDLPWPGLFGVTINSIWYWCSDQVIVQRTLAAKNYDHAKAGTILCGFIKSFGLFLLIFPGMIARILFTDTVGCADAESCMEVCGSPSSCSNIAYPLLVIHLLPAGARGMMLAVMLSALMTSLTSIFNSSSTIFAMDIWTKVRRKCSELEIMIVGRVFVIVLVVISVIWIPVLKASQGSDLYVYIQEMSSFLQPPICAVFLLGLFWPRLNEQGAFYATLIGMGTGLIRFIVEYSYRVPACDSDEIDHTPSIIKHFHYLYFSAFLFILTSISAIIISLFTKPIDKKCLQRLTWWTRHSKEKCMNIDKWMKGVESTASLSVDPENKQQIANNNGEQDEVFEDDPEPVELHNFAHMKDVAQHLMNDHHDHKSPEDELQTRSSESEEKSKSRESVSIPRRMLNWMCGIDEESKAGLMSHTVVHHDMISISQTLTWKWGSNLATIFLLGIALFYYIYFG